MFRYAWSHGIAARHGDVVRASDGALRLRTRNSRLSLTFRKALLGKDCECVTIIKPFSVFISIMLCFN